MSVRERITDWHSRHDAIFRGVINDGVKAGELADIDVSLVRHNLTGACSTSCPSGSSPAAPLHREAFDAVADSVLLMFGVGSPPPAGLAASLEAAHPGQPAVVIAGLALEVVGDLRVGEDQEPLLPQAVHDGLGDILRFEHTEVGDSVRSAAGMTAASISVRTSWGQRHDTRRPRSP